MALRKYGTCFFEQYAHISLSSILGHEFDDLVNRDRPDLQSPDGIRLGIEVTRAMEESKDAAGQMLKEISGIADVKDDPDELDRIIETGYSFGLELGHYVGRKELDYWRLALPLQRILQSKVAKAGNGFYGTFEKMGLYVFCKDPINDADAIKAYRFVMGLQKYQDIRYNRLYLAEATNLYVCNLDDGLSEDSRMIRYPVTRDMRQDFYLEAVRSQLISDKRR